MQQVLALLPTGWMNSIQVLSGENGTRVGQVKQDFSRLDATPGNTRLSDAVADSLRSEMKSLVDAVKLARTLEGCRRGRHEVEIGPTIQDTPLQQTQDARIVARLLFIDSAVRAHDGDLDGALDSCRAMLGAGLDRRRALSDFRSGSFCSRVPCSAIRAPSDRAGRAVRRSASAVSGRGSRRTGRAPHGEPDKGRTRRIHRVDPAGE